MSGKNWFVHIQGETLGPVSAESIKKMIQQVRLHFSDFIWTEGFTKWARVSDVDDFVDLMPAYPKVPIPSGAKMPTRPAVRTAQPTTADEAPKKKKPLEGKSRPAPKPQPVREEEVEETGEEQLVEEVSQKPNPPAAAQVEKKAPSKKIEWEKDRRFIRVKIDGGVKTSEHGNYEVVDISEGGLFVSTDKILAIGTELKFHFQTEVFEEKLILTGLVIRHGESHGKKGFAIEFTRLNPSYRRLIQSYVKKFEQG